MTQTEIDGLAKKVQRLIDNSDTDCLHKQRIINDADVALYDLVQLALRAAE